MESYRPRLNKHFDTELITEFLKSVSPEDFAEFVDAYNKGTNVDKKIELDLIERRYKSDNSSIKKEYNALINRHNDLESHYDNILYLDSVSPDIKTIEASKENKKGEAVAFTQWSDWHVDEVVELKKVHGINEYNPEIARQRSVNLAQNFVKMVEKERQSVHIDTAVIHLGGDFVGGWIHPELEQTNSMSPIEAVIFSEELLSDCLNFVLNHGGFARIICVCNAGNHGRITQKMQINNQMATNYETLIFNKLSKSFPEMEFIIPESDIEYMDIFGQKIRFIHGHQIKYGGGVGGLSISLNKKQAKWDNTIKADYNFMGHYHCLSYPNTRTTLNGSLKGYDTFAQTIAADSQPAQQSFQLLDSKRGWTIKAPIFTD